MKHQFSGPRLDRIVPLVTLVLIGLGVIFLIELNPQSLIVNLGESLPSFSVAWPLLGVLAIITGIGVELVARAQPQLYRSGWITQFTWGTRVIELALPLWSIPVMTPIAIFAFFRLFRGVLQTNAYLLVLVATFVILITVLSAQHYLLVGSPRTQHIARNVLTTIAYGLAFAIFSAVAFNRYRTLYAIALVFPSVLLLSADLLRGRVAALWTNASVIALLIIQGYWTLNYWPASYLLTSVTLLVMFYIFVGISQHAGAAGETGRPQLENGLGRRVIIEYGVLGIVLLTVLVAAINYLRVRNIDLRLP